jgi:carbonic anhydrase
MLLPWQKMGILTCIDNRLNLEQILNLDQLIELYVYAAVYNFSKGEEAVMKRVWQNIQSAKTFSEYDQSTIENKRNYTGS